MISNPTPEIDALSDYSSAVDKPAQPQGSETPADECHWPRSSPPPFMPPQMPPPLAASDAAASKADRTCQPPEEPGAASDVSAAGASPADLSPDRAVLDRARRGDTSVLPELQQVLDAKPDLWRMYGDVAKQAESRWLQAINGNNLLGIMCSRRVIAEQNAMLAGPTPTPLEQLLVEQISTCRLSCQHAELHLASHNAGGIALRKLQIRRLESANRNLINAIKGLAQVRKLAAGLKIEIRHTTAESAAATAGAACADVAAAQGAKTPMPVAERIRGLVDEGARAEEVLA